MKRLVLVALLALAAAAPAQGKEYSRATVCGADRCNTITDRDDLRALAVRGDRTQPPPAPGPFYSVEFGVGEFAWTIWYAPAGKAIAVVNESGNVTWHPVDDAAGFERAARGLAPFPRPQLTSVRIGNRVINDGAGTYLGLFTQPAGGAVGNPTLTDWVTVDLRSARPTPWTLGDAEFSFSRDGRLLERSWELIALPKGTADAIAAADELPAAGAGDRSVPLGVIAAGLALLAATPLLLRRRLGRGREGAGGRLTAPTLRV